MPELTTAIAASTLNAWTLIAEATLIVKAVIGLLVLMSLGCWYIIGYKYRFLSAATRQSKRFIDAFWHSRNIDEIYQTAKELKKSPIAAMFQAGYKELARLNSDAKTTAAERDREADLANINRTLHRAQTTEITKLESMVPFLATTGSAAPFIGLFGTVWGIMMAFLSMDKKGATIEKVAPGIAEALFATAIGLVAAIPAVMAYNYFQRRIRVHVADMQTFTQDYLNIVRRHFLS